MKRGRKKRLPEMVLTPEQVEECLRAAAGTVREVERQVERCFMMLADAARLRLRGVG